MRRRLLTPLLLLLLVLPAGVRAAVEPIDAEPERPRLYVSPVRFEPVDAAPGGQLRFSLRVGNTTNAPISVTMQAVPLAGSSDPDHLVEATRATSGRSAAASWVRFTDVPTERLQPNTRWTLDAVVDVPTTARPGTYAIAFAARQRVGRRTSTSGDLAAPEVQLASAPATTAIIRVEGTAVADARIRQIDAPRVIWRDRSAAFDVVVDNVGETDLRVDAQVELGAFLASAGRTLRADEQLVLPDGRRVLQMTWSDPPLLGWFTPKLTVVGGAGSGVRVVDELPTVWVVPPWWLIAGAVLAAALPIGMGVRRRRRR